MSLSYQQISRRLRMKIVDFRKKEFNKDGYIELRRKRIDEAIEFEEGPNPKDKKKTVIDELDNGTEVYFLKPGKESERNKNPNPHDMLPGVGDYYERYGFNEAWAVLTQTAYQDKKLFKSLLVLVYRLAFFEDHKEVEEGLVRYRPDDEVMEVIAHIDQEVGETVPGGILELLHFLDVLAWNEDVKYHEARSNNLKDDFNIGRTNNLLTTVDIPYKLTLFVDHILKNSEEPEKINMIKGLDSMQDLLMSGGISTPTTSELEEWFEPTLYK